MSGARNGKRNPLFEDFTFSEVGATQISLSPPRCRHCRLLNIHSRYCPNVNQYFMQYFIQNFIQCFIQYFIQYFKQYWKQYFIQYFIHISHNISYNISSIFNTIFHTFATWLYTSDIVQTKFHACVLCILVI